MPEKTEKTEKEREGKGRKRGGGEMGYLERFSRPAIRQLLDLTPFQILSRSSCGWRFLSFPFTIAKTLLANVIFLRRRGAAAPHVCKKLSYKFYGTLRTATIQLDINSINWARSSFLIKNNSFCASEQSWSLLNFYIALFSITRDEFCLLYFVLHSVKNASAYLLNFTRILLDINITFILVLVKKCSLHF